MQALNGSLPALGYAQGRRVLFYDTFTAANGTLVTTRTPDIVTAGGWSSTSGNFVINSNRANGNTAVGQDTIVANVLTANVQITADVLSAATGNIYISSIFRYTDANNYWLFRWTNTLTPQAILVERTAAVNSVRTSQAGTLPANNTAYNLTIALSGNNISLTIGAISLEFTSSAHNTATQHGLNALQAIENLGRTSFDNFRIVGL